MVTWIRTGMRATAMLLTGIALSLNSSASAADSSAAPTDSAVARVTLVKLARPILLFEDASTRTAVLSTGVASVLASLAGRPSDATVIHVRIQHDSPEATGAPLPDGKQVLRIVLRSE